MSCIVAINEEVRNTEFYRMLQKRCGSNDSALIGYFLQVATNSGFKPEFKRWYKERRPNSEPLTFDNVNTRTIMNDVIAYCNRSHPDGNDTVMKEFKTTFAAYSSVGDRRFCIERVQAQLKNDYFYHRNVVGDVRDYTYDKWCDLATEKFFNKVVERVCQTAGITQEELRAKFNSKRRMDRYHWYVDEAGLSKERAKTLSGWFEYLTIAREILGKDINIQDQNLLATLDEMLDYHKRSDGSIVRDTYFEEVFNNPDLRILQRPVDESEDENQVQQAISEAISDGVNVDEGLPIMELAKDETIGGYDSHDGQFATFMMHLSDNVQAYFNSLPVLKSTRMQNGVYDYDTNNAVGLSYTMNARQVAGMLYGRAKTDGNIEEFIESIREIAETTPGYEGLIKLYYDLTGYKKEDGTQSPDMSAFAEELFDIFAKTAIAKKELYIDRNGELKCRITNTMTSPRDSFRIQLINSIKYSSVKAEYGLSKERVNSLIGDLKAIEQALRDGYKTINGKNIPNYTKTSEVYQADKRALINKIYDTFKWYYPNLTLSSFLNYVDNKEIINKTTREKEINELANINNLINLLNQTVDAAVKTQQNYEARSTEAARARYDNDQLRQAAQFDPNIDETMFKNIDEIYAKEYLDESTKAAAIAVADALLNYSVVKTQFNSRNAAGNNSSDILNNSMISYLKRIIENSDNTQDNGLSPLNIFGRYKFNHNRSRQFDDSNLLVEHRDKDGRIINLGLFRKIVRFSSIIKQNVITYEPTEYATDLLKFTLFNGTADHLKNKSALYANMSKGDYLISAITAFFNSNYDSVQGYEVSDFFLRTPSDAPKNFFLTMPRYSSEGLFYITEGNRAIIDEDINKRITSIAIVDKQQGSKAKGISENLLIDLIVGNSVDRIYVAKDNYKKTNDGTYVTLESGKTRIIVKGELVETPTKKNYIEGVEFVGVLKNDKFDGLSEEITNRIREYYAKQLSTNQLHLLTGELVQRSINHNHPIFRQMFNVAKQEITNAGTALITMFERVHRVDELTGETVSVFVDNDEVKWTGVFASVEDPDNMTEEVYHHAPGKKVVVRDGKILKLTGKVFTSDRFTKFSDIFEDDGRKVRYVNENYLADLFVDGVATEEDGRIHLLYGGYNTHLHINDDGTITLTDAQTRYIESCIDRFIIDYVNATYDRVNEFSGIMRDDVRHSYDDIAEFILNYRLAYYAAADLLEGDSKCYKSFVDFLKRAKEVQGAGVPYSALDYTREICSSRELLPYSSLNRNVTIDGLIKAGKLHDAKAYNVFRGVTVRNSIRTGETIGEFVRGENGRPIKNEHGNYEFSKIGVLAQTYIDVLVKQGYSKEKATNKVANYLAGYADTKVNDAQSYITFEEWIRRISMRGQLPKYLPLIERICDESKPLTINDIEEFIQVQKNFYYDLYNDTNTNHQRPRQIKNAEFVLVPRLIKGTQLEKVYDTMIEHGIDQLNTVETSKAGKSNILTLWDNDGNFTDEWFNAKPGVIENAIELFDYSFLYTQQETPQHANAENKAAIQLMKRVVDNIPQYLNGKEHPLWKAKQKFQALYAQNIKESNRNLLERLNIKYDENGNFSMSDVEGIVGLDTQVFCDMLKDELLRQAQDVEMMDYVTLNTSPVEELLTSNGFGLDTRMPIIANNAVRVKFESIAQALFNSNITRQTLPGFHAAQVTGIGWKTTNEVVYNLIPMYNGTDLKKQLTAKQWRKLDKKDRGKYIPNNGIGTATDLKYHPAEYKNKKTGKIITEQQYLDLSEDGKQGYVLNGAATYIEVRVPKSMFNFDYYHRDKNGDITRLKTDEELLQELQRAGLDEFVGYRIPTEGKQSIAIMKVAGFIDDSYGSTIIVPDDWVAQTGSDFDIDSIYSVLYNNTINKITGRIEKIKYLTDFNWSTYISYIRRRAKNKISKKEEIQEKKDALYEDIKTRRQNDFITALEAEDEAYHDLPEHLQKIIKTAQQIKKAGKSKQEVALERGNAVIEALNKYAEEQVTNDDELRQIQVYIDIREKLNEAISSDKYKKEVIEGIEEINREIEAKAIELGLPSYEQYMALSEMEKNSRRARSNELISTMIDILKSDWSMEENLSQSNFREVVSARDRIISERDAVGKQARSPYDFMDQADNMEEAISGRALKGISVAYDNMVSISNTVRPTLSSTHSITIIYPADKYDFNELSRRFNVFETDGRGREILDLEGRPRILKENVRILKDEEGNPTGKISVTHTRFGWSNDNRNVADFFITTYGSQTTAHQLDIIKEGAIPNVNDYTFTVYKLFPAVGSDYDTAIAFMMQPGITEIVNAYNRSKSIYSSRYEDPIRTAVISLAKKINPNIRYYGEAVRLLEKQLSESNINHMNVLDYDRLKARFDESDNVLFDYLVVKKFQELKNTSDKINAYGFVINPDKYGAKQTIFATEEIMTKISDINEDIDPVFLPVKNAYDENVLFLDAIFPGISKVATEGLDSYLKTSDDEASVYKPLHCFMKYSTVPSIIVNRRLFQTQHPNFRAIVNSIKSIMSGRNPVLTEDTEDSFTSYIISYLHNNLDIISRPVEYHEGDPILHYTNGSQVRERVRVYGFFDKGQGVNFRVKEEGKWVDINPVDMSDPKEVDIQRFLKLTPAQKVAYVQEHFSDPLACKYLTVNLAVHNKYDRFNRDGQSIMFDEDKVDINNVREEFRKMFMNDNAFLRLTAMDLIKYAYIVEGRSRSRNTIGKMIPNSVLMQSRETRGTGIVDSLKRQWDELINNNIGTTVDNLVEYYVRSHQTMSEISQSYINADDMIRYFKNKVGDILIILDSDNTRDFILNKGIAYEEISFDEEGEKIVKLKKNHYINVTTYKGGKQVTTLYKIHDGIADGQFVLTPLNTLEPNEFGTISSNASNNKHYFPDFYDSLIQDWHLNNNGISLNSYYAANRTSDERKAATPAQIKLVGSTKKINRLNIKDIPQVESAIREHFNGFNFGPLYLRNKDLDKIFIGAKRGIKGTTIDIELDGFYYRIYKTFSKVFDKYKDNDNPVSKEDSVIKSIVEETRSWGGKNYDDVYCVVPIVQTKDEVRSSTVIEKPLLNNAVEAHNFVNRLASTGDENAIRTSRINTADGIEADVRSVRDHLETSLINTKEWLHREVELLINGDENRPGFNLFWFDHETDHYLKMTDPKVFAQMLDNPILHRSFLKTYLDALRLIDAFEMFDYTSYTEEEAGLQSHVDDIIKEINRLKENKIFKEAERLYVTEHLAKVSKNPNIQHNIISLLEGYHKTSFITAHINDLQDTSNPIIQIITRDVMADIRAKELQAEEAVRLFDRAAKAIIEKANAAGMPIDFDKIIDESGKWIEEFNDDLKIDMANLAQAKTNAYNAYKESTGSYLEKVRLFEDYLKAKYNYERFLLKNINREIEDNYYHELLQNVDRMRYQNGDFLEIFVEYEMLSDQKMTLSKQADEDGGLDEAVEKQINEIQRKLRELLSPVVFLEDGEIISKGKVESFLGDPLTDRKRKLNDIEQVNKLSDYLANRSSIQQEYIDYGEKDSFRELLNRYLDIVNSREKRDPVTNIPTVSPLTLANDREYTQAKDWLRNNAIYKYGLDKREVDRLTVAQTIDYLKKYYDGTIKEDSDEFKYVLASAYRYFKARKNTKSNANAIYKEIAEKHDARDADGVIDARKFTTEELQKIKEADLERLGLAEDNELSERAIIHNATRDDVIYKKSFYKKMMVDGITNPVYQDIVKRINSILRTVYSVDAGLVRTAKLSEDQLNALLVELKKLGYDVDERTFDKDTAPKRKLGVSKAQAKKAALFIKNNVDFVLTEEDQQNFDVQYSIAEKKGEEYFKLWCTVNMEWSDEKEDFVPNHLFWGHAQPKKKVLEQYIDKEKTAAVRAMRYAYNDTPSRYYEEEMSRIIRTYGLHSKEYKDWYELNHIYNPNTHKFEPIVCWTVHDINTNLKGEWMPTYNMNTKSVREEHRNKRFRKNVGYIGNYKLRSNREDQLASNVANFRLRKLKTSESDFAIATTPDGTYDRNINITPYEQEIKELFQNTLAPLAKTRKAKDYFDKGHLPVRANSEIADKPNWLTEIAKTFGLVDSNRKVYWDGDNAIGYEDDYIPPMPMMQQLTNRETINPPVREKYKDEASYNTALTDYQNHKAEIDKKNEEIHQSLIDKNWVEVIKEFIRQAGHYNAIQDNKYQLYFGQKLLEDIKIYETRSDTHKQLKKKGVANGGKQQYKQSSDKQLQEQYNNWLHRVIFDHYKQSQGVGERIGNMMQGFTSTSYMTVNVRAGIANVLVGDTNILGEVFAKEYLGFTEWGIGKRFWAQSMLDFIYHMYDDRSDTKAGAIIKGMNVVDYSELNGRITQVDLKKWSQLVTDFGFSFNNIGEHMMQNSAMFAMMISHKVIQNPNYGKPGEREWIVVNFSEYSQNVREEIMREMCTEEQEKAYDLFIANIKKDPNGAKNFAWYREEPVAKFIADNFTREQRKEFKKRVDQRKAEMLKEFKNAKTVWDQLDKTDDGYMTFAKGSIFEGLNTIKENQEVSEAYRLLGEFKGRVISVNKKIHGNYGKLDAAMIEKFYLGRLLMQYHKHIPVGIAKRYRREGYFNEERGTIEKGMYTSLVDFLAFPVKALRDRGDISEDEAKTLTGLQNLFSNIVDYFKYLSAYRDIMPDYERANLHRILGNTTAMLFSVAGAIGIKIAWDEDDRDGIAYNLLIYEMDRLASESFMWNPYGAFSEAKKLWSSPIAAQSIISDCMNILGTITGIILDGDDYDPYYHSGRYAGRHKLGVYVERRIPYYRNYASIRDIADSNHYYKIGDNILSWVPVEDIANAIKGK